MRIALFQPDIAGNVGTILRLAACWHIGVDIILPCGFPASDAQLRRAAMDYGGHAEVTRHADFAAFAAARLTDGTRLIALTSAGGLLALRRALQGRRHMLMGRESAGLPPDLHARADLRLRIPMAAGFAAGPACARGPAPEDSDGGGLSFLEPRRRIGHRARRGDAADAPFPRVMLSRRRTMGERIENQRLDGTEYHNCSMTEVTFDDVNLKGARFHNVNLAGATLDDVNLSNLTIVNANVEGLTIYGYDIHALLQPLLERDSKAGKSD